MAIYILKTSGKILNNNLDASNYLYITGSALPYRREFSAMKHYMVH